MSLETVVSVVVGGIITWIASHAYYRKAGDQLTKEAVELQRLVTLVLGGLEEGNLVKLNRDESGVISGIVVQLQATLRAAASATAVGEVVKG